MDLLWTWTQKKSSLPDFARKSGDRYHLRELSGEDLRQVQLRAYTSKISCYNVKLLYCNMHANFMFITSLWIFLDICTSAHSDLLNVQFCLPGFNDFLWYLAFVSFLYPKRHSVLSCCHYGYFWIIWSTATDDRSKPKICVCSGLTLLPSYIKSSESGWITRNIDGGKQTSSR